ncbi:aminotransferase class III-fold pyridoxal phosphate-dependent enzyme [Candidatus Sumerlaeota bacterium]|nr:aminotransferase class III-fold pyridoxal phosphate-dependent enzyme [Candidatus Sumerlaeota bacterium]
MSDHSTNLDPLRSEGDLNLTPRRRQWSEHQIDDDTRALLDEDSKYFLHQSLSTPCLNVLDGCDGIYLTDHKGRRYMDFHGNNVHQVGFGHPRALKLARAATGKFKTISMWDSFHGASLDAISIGGEAIFRGGIGPLLPGTEHVPPPDAQHCPWDCKGQCTLKCADYIEYVLEKEGDVGAVIAETVRSTPFIPPLDYWKKVRAACDKHGALLILDEIPTCLGRTGKMFACEHYGIVPDMLVIGKGLGGGVFPLAALIAREGLNVMADRALGHYTHEKNPVACAAALATIQCLEEDGVLQNAVTMGEHALGRMNEMMSRHPIIGAVRGLGLMLGIELVKDRATMEKASDAAEQVMYSALSNGLNFKLTMGNIITLTPPLTITRQQLDEAFDIIESCLREVN